MDRTAREELLTQQRDFTVLIGMTAALLAAVTLLLWPLGQLTLAWSLVRAFAVFYLTTWVLFLVCLLVQRAFRIDDDQRLNAYLLSNLAAGAVPLAGWCAFAALAVRAAAAGAAPWRAAPLWLAGLLTCWMACTVVTTYYHGAFYKRILLPLAPAAFLAFALVPAAGELLFGWYVELWS